MTTWKARKDGNGIDYWIDNGDNRHPVHITIEKAVDETHAAVKQRAERVATLPQLEQERALLLAACKNLRDHWSDNLTEPMNQINEAIDFCEMRKKS